ncbi:tetratricopeptide repeat protein [Patescibacteria group bacterium]
MIIDLFIWIILIAAVISVLVVMVRKFSVISAVDVNAQPGSKSKKIKADLLEQRLDRKVSGLGAWIGKYITPVWEGAREAFRRLLQTVAELNKKYDRKIKARQASTAPPDDVKEKIRQLIFEADENANREEYAEAEQRLIEVVTLDSKNSDAYHRLGDIYLEQKNYEDARQTFEHLIKLNQADDTAFSGLAHIAEAEGRLTEARDEYLHSIDLNAKAAQHHLDLCKVYIEMEEFDDAVKSCTKAVKIEPNNPKMLANLLDAYLGAKDSANAKAILGKIKEVNPENQKLEEWRNIIDKL